MVGELQQSSSGWYFIGGTRFVKTAAPTFAAVTSTMGITEAAGCPATVCFMIVPFVGFMDIARADGCSAMVWSFVFAFLVSLS